MSYDKLKIRRGLKQDLPSLEVGEIGFTTDTNELFVGNFDGNKKPNDLGIVNVKDFGAKGDDITDDTEALMKTRDYILSKGGIFYIPEGMNCKATGNIDLMGVKNIQINGKITGDGLTNELIVGIRSQVVFPANYLINEVANIKIRVQGLKNGNVQINNCSHLLLWADGDISNINSLAYNNFYLGKIDKLEINSQGSNGWVNENKFFGGRITEIYIDGTYSHNNNIFYSPCVEGGIINIARGNSNQFHDVRLEGSNTITFAETTFNNNIFRSYQPSAHVYLRDTSSVAYTNNGYNNYVLNLADTFNVKEIIFEINTMSNNFDLAKFTKNETTLMSKSGSGIVYESDFIKLDEAIGFLIETDGRCYPSMYIFDENKNPILQAPTNFTSIIGSTFNTSEGRYTVSNIQKIGFPTTKHPVVKYVKLLISMTAYTGEFSYLKLTKIERVGKNTSIKPLKKYNLKNLSAPIDGNWIQSSIVYNSNPIAGGYLGWVCTSSGTPGTWKGFGLIEV